MDEAPEVGLPETLPDDMAGVATFVQRLRESGVKHLHWEPDTKVLDVEFHPLGRPAPRRSDDDE